MCRCDSIGPTQPGESIDAMLSSRFQPNAVAQRSQCVQRLINLLAFFQIASPRCKSSRLRRTSARSASYIRRGNFLGSVSDIASR